MQEGQQITFTPLSRGYYRCNQTGKRIKGSKLNAYRNAHQGRRQVKPVPVYVPAPKPPKIRVIEIRVQPLFFKPAAFLQPDDPLLLAELELEAELRAMEEQFA